MTCCFGFCLEGLSGKANQAHKKTATTIRAAEVIPFRFIRALLFKTIHFLSLSGLSVLSFCLDCVFVDIAC